MTKIKICGFTNFADAYYANNYGADALGFVIDVPINTARNMTIEQTRTIIQQLPPYTYVIGVTMEKTIEELIQIIDQTGISSLQIHGEFSDEKIAALKKIRGIPIIRSYTIENGCSSKQVITAIEKGIENGIDAVLLDTKGEKGGGGTGKVHDWTVSSNVRHSFDFPFILAGGIRLENVEQAIEQVEPYAIDLASGVEAEPGKKDPEKIQTLIQKVREIT
ncbi:MAG: hypothetical protein GF308_10185 [Candidatus Heimdallarchaeota archaeon]|nr:hypothetical protein [Candidatus Heimdallarchaeota archaeon]